MKNGFSLVETILVIAIGGILIILLANLPSALTLITKSKNTSIAKEIAAKQIEDKRNISYSNLANDKGNITDPRLSLLPQGEGTITVEDCDLSVCTNGESIKQVTVSITWKDNQKPQEVRIKTLVGEGGLNQ